MVISHRLLSVRNADLIYVMEEGRIVEAGPWSELVVAGTRFNALVQAQHPG